ncbi:MAG: reverse transcriptase family protein, partial [Flavobacteriaceae bacterium]|nr:reverse transcriptase family protein [Flavobacteriaceae bacterium]
NQLVNAIENNQFSCCIFLDFAKAFDTVNHNILLTKLEHYGIRGVALEWFRSYLTDRTQRVSVGGTLSNSNYNHHGVPQGSVLGPLLFLLYINDIPQSSKIMSFHLFADDTSLFYSNKNIDNLEETVNCELAKISDWLIANKLTLNVNKSNFMIIKPRQKKLPRNVNLSLNSETLEESDCVKYLGVLIDKNLTWKNHIKHVTTKVAKSIGILSKIRHFAPKNVLINVFNAFISPHINYGIINWGGAYPSSLDQLNKCLKKAARIITFKPQNEPSKPILKELNSLNLEDTYKLECAKFMFELYKGNYNSLYSHLFQLTKNQHNINTRQAAAGKFCTPVVRTNYKKHFITYSGVKIWNTIPENIRNSRQKKSFSKLYKKMLLNNY